MKKLIYKNPSLAPLPQRLGWAICTACFWLAWIYLWLPLITFGLWTMGIHSIYVFHVQPHLHGDPVEFMRITMLYGAIALGLGGGLLLWARLEFMRFHNVSRRAQPEAARIEALAEFSGHSQAAVHGWQQARRMRAHHDDHGHLLDVELLD